MLFITIPPPRGAAGLGLEAATDHPLFTLAVGVVAIDIPAEKAGELLLFGMVFDMPDH